MKRFSKIVATLAVGVSLGLGAMTLSGCGSERNMKDVSTLYTQMVETYQKATIAQNDPANDIFTNGVFDINYSVDVMNKDSVSDSALNDMGDKLKISYVQLNTLYEKVLKLSNKLYVDFGPGVLFSDEYKDVSGSDITTLYNKLSNLKNEVVNFNTSKTSIEEIVGFADKENAMVNRIKTFNYNYGKLIEKNIDFIRSFDEVLQRNLNLDVKVLSDNDLTLADTSVLTYVLDRAYFRYAELVYNQIILPRMNNNACNTADVQYLVGGSLSSYPILTGYDMLGNLNNMLIVDAATGQISQTLVDAGISLNSATVNFDKYFTFYNTAINGVDFTRLNEVLLNDATFDENTYDEYFGGLSRSQQGNVNIIEDFLISQALDLYNAITQVTTKF